MPKSRIPPPLRAAVARRAHWCCEYCKSQERFAPQLFTLDHIRPESLGGPDDLENLAYACQGCNGSKADRTGLLDAVTGAFAPFFNPRTQVWAEHFAWNEGFSQIIA